MSFSLKIIVACFLLAGYGLVGVPNLSSLGLRLASVKAAMAAWNGDDWADVYEEVHTGDRSEDPVSPSKDAPPASGWMLADQADDLPSDDDTLVSRATSRAVALSGVPEVSAD